MPTATLNGSSNGHAAALPGSDADFYALEALLTDEERAVVDRVRAFMEAQIVPVINDHWMRASFPHDLLPAFAETGIFGLPYDGYGCLGGSKILNGLVERTISEYDPSMGTFFGVQSGLAMGSIYLLGSDAQKERWLPAMQRLEKIGSFGLTEPNVGSAISREMGTTARRDGDTWVLNGQKKWIGNGTFADVNIVWARDEADGQIKGFLVEGDAPGFSAEKMEHKMALRVVQNAILTMDDCRIPADAKLEGANSFRDTARVLKMTRVGVAWQAVGCAAGAYQLALDYAKERQQFGRPIAGFQLVQDLLVRMLGNVTAAGCLAMRLTQLQDAGQMSNEQASLAKAFCTVKCRETVGWARELLGGNGILLDYHVGRFVADCEAIYSYEGTREINSLIVGRAITGESAFV
ncbi:MAG: acyl-CoA dehydrogenase family protein [Bacteroidota bacterium]